MSWSKVETVAKEAEGEIAGWTVKLIIFVGGTCGSVHVQTFNSNLKELGAVLCSYFAQRMGTKNDGCGQKSEGEEIFQGLERFE
jgi:hypothetical protein